MRDGGGGWQQRCRRCCPQASTQPPPSSSSCPESHHLPELFRSVLSPRQLLEKEILERQNSWLNEELIAKVNNYLELRKKHIELDADMSSKLADVERQFSECSKSLQWNKDRVRELETKLKSLQEDLISAKDAAAAKEQGLSAELFTGYWMVKRAVGTKACLLGTEIESNMNLNWLVL